MAKGDRLSIDLGGLRERIENYQDGVAWERLPAAQKIKILLEQGLQYDDLRQVVSALKKLVQGEKPSLADITVAADVLEIAPEELSAFCDRVLKLDANGEANEPAKNGK